MTSEQIPAELQGALKRLGGDIALLQDMARFYLEDSPQLLRDLEHHLKSGQAMAAKRSAHSLKGLSANFDRIELIEACADAERLAHAGQLDEARSILPNVQSQANRLAVDLAEFLQDDRTN